MASRSPIRHSAHLYSANPRRHALEVVTEALSPRGRGFAQELLDRRMESARLKPEDRRLAAELSLGVIRRLRTLDCILSAYAQRDDIELPVRNVLRLGVYQLVFMERVPAHAAVDESVRLARATGRGAASGFVNAVLRAVAREVAFLSAPDAAQPRRSFALSDSRAVLFARDVLPDPGLLKPSEGTSTLSQGSPNTPQPVTPQPCEGPNEPSQGCKVPAADWLGAVHSLPTVLVRRWLERFGPARTRELCATVNDIPPLFVRPNSARVSMTELQCHLREEGVEAMPSPTGRTLRLPPHTMAARLRCFSEGLFQVQDDSSAAVGEFLGVTPGMHVLDLCAAPGGKCCHIAELMRGSGRVVAVDSSRKRLARVVENARMLGLRIIDALEADGVEYALAHAGEFDRVLLDAPCSNTGVLRRRVEARWRFSTAALAELTRIQRRLLDAALGAVRPGGTLAYSTCSLEAEENSTQVASALAGRTGYRLDGERQIFPTRDGGDGIYMARIIRMQ